ncbi:MAG: hypothetical protein AAGC79_09630, partial [Pseudomonadota bacterium]
PAFLLIDIRAQKPADESTEENAEAASPSDKPQDDQTKVLEDVKAEATEAQETAPDSKDSAAA